jgi:hypothetical protein
MGACSLDIIYLSTGGLGEPGTDDMSWPVRRSRTGVRHMGRYPERALTEAAALRENPIPTMA